MSAAYLINNTEENKEEGKNDQLSDSPQVRCTMSVTSPLASPPGPMQLTQSLAFVELFLRLSCVFP